jgi:soluble lytic murein transglycosylase-like protein
MHRRLKAVIAPVVVAGSLTWAGFARPQSSDAESPSDRLDELGKARPAAAPSRAVDGVLAAASQAADEKRWIEGAQRLQLELFYEGIMKAEAEKAAAAESAAAAATAAAKARAPKPAPAQTGRVGGSGTSTSTSSSVGGACGGASNGADAYIGRESGGNPNARNPSGAWGCYQIMPGTWSSSCSDLGAHGSASTSAQAQCASRLPASSWSSSGPTR